MSELKAYDFKLRPWIDSVRDNWEQHEAGQRSLQGFQDLS